MKSSSDLPTIIFSPSTAFYYSQILKAYRIFLFFLFSYPITALISQTPGNPPVVGTSTCNCAVEAPSVPICPNYDCLPTNNTSEYYFYRCMSQEVLKLYLARTIVYTNPQDCQRFVNPPGQCTIDPSTNCFRDNIICDFDNARSCIDEDLEYLRTIKPKLIFRSIDSWGGAEFQGFEEEKVFAHKIHCEVDSEIILDGAILEYVCSTGVNSIVIPQYVRNAFNYTGGTNFNCMEMLYNGVSPQATCGTPDISKTMTKMWYYYVATQFIIHGYESIHMGDWRVIVENDPNHSNIWEVLCKIRSFAYQNARRKFVLINGGGSHTNGIHHMPYAFNISQNQLLFDYLLHPIGFQETYCVANPDNPFFKDPSDVRLDRLVKLPDDMSVYNFGGTSAQSNCNQACYQIKDLPYLVQLDVGGFVDDMAAQIEGTCTSTGPTSFLTWGWGGETNYFHYLSTPIKQQLLTYFFYEVTKRSNGIGAFALPFKQQLSSRHLKALSGGLCDGGENFYFKYSDCNSCEPCHQPDLSLMPWCNVNKLICENIADPLKKLLAESEDYKVEFCAPEVIHQDFSADQGWTSPDYARFMMDVNHDGLLDIVGLGHSLVFVTKNLGNSFEQNASIWGNKLTVFDGWSQSNFRSTGDFNGDGNADLVGVKNGVIWVGLSNGQNAFVFSQWAQFVPAGGTWKVGKFTNDSKDDLVLITPSGNDVRIFLFSSSGTQFTNSSVRTYSYPGISEYTLEDINGDGIKDVVGLPVGNINSTTVVRVGLITNNQLPDNLSGYGTTLNLDCMASQPSDCCNNFEQSHCQAGWGSYRHLRLFGDVDNDNDKDLILFGEEGVMVAKNLFPLEEFDRPRYWIYDFGSKLRGGGWNNHEHIRTIGDVNGDGNEDVIGFGEHEVFVMLSAGNYFIAPVGYPNFADEPDGGGWDTYRHVRMVTDYDNDGKVEIVGFGEYDVLAINCSDQSGPFFKPGNTSSEQEGDSKNEYGLTAFPNPFNANLNLRITAPVSNTVAISLIDIRGQEVAQKVIRCNSGKTETEMAIQNNLPAGIYLLKLVFEDGVTVINKMHKL